jgi:hypothetical protein
MRPRLGRRDSRRGAFRRERRHYREHHRERAALPKARALGRDRTAVQLDQPLREREPDT